jgi:hypothetical protein
VDDEALSRDWGAPTVVTAMAPLGLFGFCEGYDLGFKRGVGAAILALRDELIRGGTDPGTAAVVAQKLARACGVRGG